MTKFQLKVTDRGAQKLVRQASQFRGRVALLVGVQGAKAAVKHGEKPKRKNPETVEPEKTDEPQGPTVAEIAEAHEFGLGVPERSWLRSWFDEHQNEIKEDIRKVTRGVLMGKISREQALKLLGVKYQGQIQKRISDGKITPPLSDYTKDKKGSSVPLIDTGQLRSAISWKLETLMGYPTT